MYLRGRHVEVVAEERHEARLVLLADERRADLDRPVRRVGAHDEHET